MENGVVASKSIKRLSHLRLSYFHPYLFWYHFLPYPKIYRCVIKMSSDLLGSPRYSWKTLANFRKMFRLRASFGESSEISVVERVGIGLGTSSKTSLLHWYVNVCGVLKWIIKITWSLRDMKFQFPGTSKNISRVSEYLSKRDVISSVSYIQNR